MIDIYFGNTITRRRPVTNKYGQSTNTDVAYPARVEETNRTIKGQDGIFHQCSYRIYLNLSADIKPQDRIILDPIATGVTPKEWGIMQIFDPKAFGSVREHIEVMV